MQNLNPMKVLLSVIDSEYPSIICLDELVRDSHLLKSVIKLAEKNGLYYDFMCRLKEQELSLESVEEHRWDEEKQRLQELKKTLILLDKAAIDNDIDYVIIKACNSIPHVPRDIDIFVRKNDRMKMIEALEEKGMNRVQEGIAETSLKGDFMKVDIYTEICYIGTDFIDGEFLLQSRIKDKIFGVDYYGLNNEANLLLLLVHSLFGHRCISLLDFLHIKHIRNDTSIDTCKKYACEAGWESVFNFVLNELDSFKDEIYINDKSISFPCLFDSKFVWKCARGIKNLELNRKNRLFLHITLAQDRVIYEMKDTPIYEIVKSFEPARNLINSLTAFVKSQRGDKKSLN